MEEIKSLVVSELKEVKRDIGEVKEEMSKTEIRCKWWRLEFNS